MNILNVENVSKSYMSKPVLSGVSVGINDTDKIGVVGTNGTGKSTLLSIIAGATTPDSGQVIASNGLRISYLPQNPEAEYPHYPHPVQPWHCKELCKGMSAADLQTFP